MEVAIKQGRPEEECAVILYGLQWCMKSLLLSWCLWSVVASELGDQLLHGGNGFDEEACEGKLDVVHQLSAATKEAEEILNNWFRK